VAFRGGTHLLTSAPQSTALVAVCEYDGAADTAYGYFTAAIRVGAGAGVSMGLCVPSDDAGLCLTGTVNYVDISITPTIGHTQFTLYNAQKKAIGKRGNTFVDVPWQLSLFSGQVIFTINLGVFTISFPIAEWAGLKVAGSS